MWQRKAQHNREFKVDQKKLNRGWGRGLVEAIKGGHLI